MDRIVNKNNKLLHYYKLNLKNMQVNIISIILVMEEGNEVINPDGLTKFLNDLGLEPVDPLTLMISWKFNAKKSGYYTREEFINGMGKLNCNQTKDLKNLLPKLKNDF